MQPQDFDKLGTNDVVGWEDDRGLFAFKEENEDNEIPSGMASDTSTSDSDFEADQPAILFGNKKTRKKNFKTILYPEDDFLVE